MNTGTTNLEPSDSSIIVIEQFRNQWLSHVRPDLARFLNDFGPVALRNLGALACVDMHFQWQTGNQPLAESYVKSFPELNNDIGVIVDLLYTEYLEREQQGELPDFKTYAARFPNAAEGLEQQLHFHRALDEITESTISRSGSSESDEDFSVKGGSDQPDEYSPEPFKPKIAGYDILEEIGRGGVGVVYRAFDQQLQRIVAIKVLLSGPFANSAHLRRFRSEALAAARLKHPNVIQIYEFGDYRGTPYLVLEYADCGSLANFRGSRPQSAFLASKIVLQITQAVAYIHQSGIIHRDLKPANILLSSDILDSSILRSDANVQMARGRGWPSPITLDSENVRHSTSRNNPSISGIDDVVSEGLVPKITDFGFARFALDSIDGNENSGPGKTCSGDVFGTPSYMSPELARGLGKSVGPASDIYSLGTILYELLTGRPPLVGATAIETVQLVTQREPIRPSRLVRSIPMDLETICIKCLEKDPERRYKSAGELAQDLVCFLSDRPIKARPISAVSRLYRWQRRNRLVAGLGAAVACLTLVTIAISTISLFQVRHQLANANSARVSETEARLVVIEQLWNAYLVEAETRRTSRRIGQRFAGIDALHRARALFGQIEVTEDQKRDLRNRAIGCLALPDMQRLSRWKNGAVGRSGFDSDKDLTKYVTQTPTGDVELRRIGDGNLLARIAEQPVDSVVSLSPDGNWLGVQNSQFSVYRIQRAMQNPDPVFQVPSEGGWKFMNDNQRVLGTTSEGWLVEYNLTDGREIRQLGKLFSTDPIIISSDNRYAASVVKGNIRVIDLNDGSVVRELDAPSQFNEFNNLAWSPDGSQLAAGPYDGRIHIWNIADSTIAGSYRHSGPLVVRFDSEGETLIGFNPWNGTLNVWNLASEQPLLNSVNKYFLSAQPSSDGGFKMLVKGDADALELHEIVVGRVVRSAQFSISNAGLPTGIKFSNDGNSLLISGSVSTCVLNAANLKLIDAFPHSARYSTFDEQDNVYVINEQGLGRFKKLTTLNSGQSPEFPYGELEHLLSIESYSNIAVSRDGKLVSIAVENGATIWKPDDPAAPVQIGSHSDVRSVKFSPDGKWLATGGWEGNAKIWSTSDGALIETLPTGPLCMVEFSPDGHYLATTSDGGRIWRTDDWTLHRSFGSNDSIVTGLIIRFSPDSNSVVVSNSDGQFKFLSIENGREFMTLTDPCNERVLDFAFSPDGKKLAACISEPLPRIAIWDLDLLRDRLGTYQLD